MSRPVANSRLLRALILSPLLVALAACGRHQRESGHAADVTMAASPAAPRARMAAGGGAPSPVAMEAPPLPAGEATQTKQQRHLAVRHELRVEAPADRLADAWTQVRDQCQRLGEAGCEVISSSLRRESPRQPGGASLELRVAPADVAQVLGTLAGVAKVVVHDTLSEDKTAEVIDVEAHIKNRTELRDSLRAMLADRSVKRELSDMLAIQRTLADTQADLDSRATQLKALMQLTQKQRVQIDFVAEASIGSASGTNPIARAWREAGEVLAHSAAALITFVAAVLPWGVVALPLMWALRALWRRRRARKLAA